MLKRIAITGPESTGKSSLAQNLAEHYNTLWVPEYAREYIDNLDRPYYQEDILTIAKGQLQAEEKLESSTNQLLFSDSDFLICKIWSEHKYNNCHPWILDQFLNHTYDLYLLCDIDLPWEEDPQREHPHLRKHLFDLYKSELEKAGFPFKIVSGYGNQRIQNGVSFVENLIRQVI